jgi:hypothetical protein
MLLLFLFFSVAVFSVYLALATATGYIYFLATVTGYIHFLATATGYIHFLATVTGYIRFLTTVTGYIHFLALSAASTDATHTSSPVCSFYLYTPIYGLYICIFFTVANVNE